MEELRIPFDLVDIHILAHSAGAKAGPAGRATCLCSAEAEGHGRAGAACVYAGLAGECEREPGVLN